MKFLKLCGFWLKDESSQAVWLLEKCRRILNCEVPCCMVVGCWSKDEVLKLLGCWLKDESQAMWLLYEGSPLCCCWLNEEGSHAVLLLVKGIRFSSCVVAG